MMRRAREIVAMSLSCVDPNFNQLKLAAWHFLSVTGPSHTSSVGQLISIQAGTVQHSTVKYNTVQYSAVQYSTIQYNITCLSKLVHKKRCLFQLAFKTQNKLNISPRTMINYDFYRFALILLVLVDYNMIAFFFILYCYAY